MDNKHTYDGYSVSDEDLQRIEIEILPCGCLDCHGNEETLMDLTDEIANARKKVQERAGEAARVYIQTLCRRHPREWTEESVRQRWVIREPWTTVTITNEGIGSIFRDPKTLKRPMPEAFDFDSFEKQLDSYVEPGVFVEDRPIQELWADYERVDIRCATKPCSCGSCGDNVLDITEALDRAVEFVRATSLLEPRIHVGTGWDASDETIALGKGEQKIEVPLCDGVPWSLVCVTKGTTPIESLA